MSDRYEGIRYLGACDIQFSTNGLGQLCATLADGTELTDVLVYCTRPVSDPKRYISIRVGVTTSEQREIGLIRNLDALVPDQKRLLLDALGRRYFIHIIHAVRSLREEFGYLYWECETDKGLRQFPTARWDQTKVINPGDGSAIITDVDGNRYEIPKVDNLDPENRARFYRLIHWW
jgi:hypothetical protein